jgi:hypothetical protein
MVLVVPADAAGTVLDAAGPGAYRIGEIVPGTGVVRA